MTPQELLQEVDHGTPESIARVLEGATEKERKAAAAPLVERLDAIVRPWLNDGVTLGQMRRLAMAFHGLERRDDRPHLALLGTGSLTEVKRYALTMPEGAFAVLAERRPKWLPDWAAWVLQNQTGGWPVVRRLVRERLIERPETDVYYLGMLGGCFPAGPKHLLTSDPELLEHEVWELFRREGTTEMSLQNWDAGWSDALLELSAEGRLSRDRLLTASLEALELPWKAHHTTWFRNFHDMLQPTPEERAARVPLYLALCSHAVPATAKMAVRSIEELAKTGSLPVEGFLEAALPVLTGREKGTAAAVLKLAGRALSTRPDCSAQVAALAMVALEHTAAEIQAAALDLLTRTGPLTPEQQERLAAKLELLAAPVRDRASRLLHTAEPSPTQRYTAQPHRCDPLAFAAPISPITTIEDLVLILTSVMNQAGPPDDIERVLDGLSRLCHQRPPHFDDLVSPLRKAVDRLLQPDAPVYMGGVFSIPLLMQQLAAAWIGGKLCIGLGDDSTLLPGTLGIRPYWIALRAMRREPRALLSAPTHSGGWLDPAILLERLHAGTGTADPREIEADLLHALYRLPPDRRTEVLPAAAPHLAPEHLAALQYPRTAPECRVTWIPSHNRFRPAVLCPEFLFQPEPVQHPLRLDAIFAAETQPIRLAVVREMFAMHTRDPYTRGDLLGPDVVPWAATLVPGDREGWFALAAFRIGNNLDFESANWANRHYLTVLTEPWLQPTPSTYLLLALGLMAKEATEAATARDGLQRLIADRKLDGALLGRRLGELFADGIVRGPRLAKAFTDTARLSPLHADAVRQTLESALAAGLPGRPADQSALLEAFLEACSAAGQGPAHGDLRCLLESVTGSGKAPKLARSLLALPLP